MESVVLVIHLILALAIIGLVLIQKSEGGGLGIGGGAGGLTTAHGAKSALTRATAICATCFLGTSLVLGILAGTHHEDGSILERVSDTPAPANAEDDGVEGDEVDAAASEAIEATSEEQNTEDQTQDTETEGGIPDAPVSE